MKHTWRAILLFFLCVVARAQPGSAPYVLESTEVLDVHATELKRDYQVFVSLPPSYAKTTRRYPVLFVADANYAFPLMRSISRRLGGHPPGLEEFIIVGLSYAKGDTPEFSRRRDYTPTRPSAAELNSDMPGRTPQFGQAEGYRRFVANDIFPLLAQRYRIDMGRKIFAGHSYGSLLGTHILLTDPAMFESYILSSPSLWYDKRVMFAREKAYAASHKDLKANVYLAVGALEAIKPGDKDGDDMVADLREFEGALRARHYPGLRITSRVFEGEDHLTVNPASFTHGLRWVLPRAR